MLSNYHGNDVALPFGCSLYPETLGSKTKYDSTSKETSRSCICLRRLNPVVVMYHPLLFHTKNAYIFQYIHVIYHSFSLVIEMEHEANIELYSSIHDKVILDTQTLLSHTTKAIDERAPNIFNEIRIHRTSSAMS